MNGKKLAQSCFCFSMTPVSLHPLFSIQVIQIYAPQETWLRTMLGSGDRIRKVKLSFFAKEYHNLVFLFVCVFLCVNLHAYG